LCHFLARGLPTQGCKDGKRAGRRGGARLASLPVFVALAAIVLVFTGDAGIWVFLERIGAQGHDREFGATLVSINLASGAIGSLSAAWLAERWGYLSPMAIAIGLSLVSLALFLADDYRGALMAASFVNGWAWNFGSAYRMALVARLDTSGRYTVLIPSMQTLGNTLGPTMTGLLLVNGGQTLAFSTIAGLWLAALMCYFYGWLGLKDNYDIQTESC
jgi:predicted MFS family arabinose efflux permease